MFFSEWIKLKIHEHVRDPHQKTVSKAKRRRREGENPNQTNRLYCIHGALECLLSTHMRRYWGRFDRTGFAIGVGGACPRLPSHGLGFWQIPLRDCGAFVVLHCAADGHVFGT